MNFKPQKRTLRKTGFIADQEGIYSRYLREKRFWASHLQSTREVILRFVEEVKPASLAILGSGWCLDVPLEELKNRVSRVYLADLRHPKMIRKQFRKQIHIEFAELDLTGGMIETAYEMNSQKRGLSEVLDRLLQTKPIQLPFDADSIVSVNLLNQLDILLVDYLRKKYETSEDELIPLRKHIQQLHLDLLRTKTSALIADYEEVQIDNHGTEKSSTKNVFAELKDFEITERWIWQFDNHKTYHPKYNTHLKVLAAKTR